MPTTYGESPWIKEFPASRVPAYPRPPKDLTTIDVLIIGGGLTGCATAYAFAAAGVRVALFEADRIGRGVSGASTGWIADDPGVGFPLVESTLGLRFARHGFQAWRRAALDFITLIRRLDLKCDIGVRGAMTIANTPEQLAALKKDLKIRKDAGLDAAAVNARAIRTEVGIDAPAAHRARDGAIIDPYRAAIGLAAAASDRGALIFERAPVRGTKFTRRWAVVHTATGAVRVNRVIVATGMPTALFASLRRHFWFRTSYSALTERIPAKIKRQLGARAAVVRDLASPPHIIRWVHHGEVDRLLVAGADAETVPDRLRQRTLVQRTGQLMYELSTIYPDISGLLPEYGWDAPYALTAEGLPYIGPHRNFPFHLFAFGDASHSLTGAYLASRIFLRHHLGETDAADLAFAFTRTGR
jgi:glycine/D-amino acid oxidase-like deaminating enzyme